MVRFLLFGPCVRHIFYPRNNSAKSGVGHLVFPMLSSSSSYHVVTITPNSMGLDPVLFVPSRDTSFYPKTITAKPAVHFASFVLAETTACFMQGPPSWTFSRVKFHLIGPCFGHFALFMGHIHHIWWSHSAFLLLSGRTLSYSRTISGRPEVSNFVIFDVSYELLAMWKEHHCRIRGGLISFSLTFWEGSKFCQKTITGKSGELKFVFLVLV